jgi:hypothetical protein
MLTMVKCDDRFSERPEGNVQTGVLCLEGRSHRLLQGSAFASLITKPDDETNESITTNALMHRTPAWATSGDTHRAIEGRKGSSGRRLAAIRFDVRFALAVTSIPTAHIRFG